MSKNITRLNTKTLYFFAIGIIVITRCFGSNILSSQMKLILLIGVTSLTLMRIKIRIDILDFFWMLTGMILLLHHSSSYAPVYIVFYICALLSRFIIKGSVYSINILLKIILFFSLLTAIVSWISLLFPALYTEMIVPFINPSGQAEVIKQLSIGNLAGLTDHYSRNAYYVVGGILVLLSRIWGEGNTTFNFKQDRKEWILIIFELVTLLAIGKRGHFSFLVLTVYITFILLQRTYSSKIIKSIKAIIVVTIFALVVFIFIPAAQHTLNRFVLEAATEDLSNGRLTNYAIAFDLFKQNPLLGIGYGGFRHLTANGLTQYAYAGVHNDYIQFLCETGIIGFVLFIGLGLLSLIMTGITLKWIVLNPKPYNIHLKSLMVWSFMFQFFVMAYSFTGLPHFDFEINTVYLVSCALSASIIKIVKCDIVVD